MSRFAIIREFWSFLKILVLPGAVLIFAKGFGMAPFIYCLF